MQRVLHETCQQYVARRLSEGWEIVSRYGCSVVLSPPDGSFLRPVDLRNDIETLRPNAAGDETNIPSQSPSSTYHWDKVDEAVSDGDATCVVSAYLQDDFTRDLYNLPAPSGYGTINFIKVYGRARSFAYAAVFPCFIINMKTGGTVYSSDTYTPPLTWTLYSKQWTINPKTGVAWTWEDIASLQIGISVKDGYSQPEWPRPAGCTQVYVEVDFTPISAPTVITQAVTDIAPTTSTGNGNMTDNGGENASKRGVCWNTTGNPTVADDKSEETGSFDTGAFTRPMTGLTPGQHYYVRAYAYNSVGYGYGSQVEFTTKAYYATGYIGDVIDCTDLVKTYDRLEWTEEIPDPGQAIEIKIRSSPDLSTWTVWEVIYSSPCTSFGTPVQRYLEWVATLTTDQGTPKLKDLGFFWTKKVE